MMRARARARVYVCVCVCMCVCMEGGVVDVCCVCVWANVYVCIYHSRERKIFLASKDKINKVLLL